MMTYRALREDVFAFSTLGGLVEGWTWEPLEGDYVKVTGQPRTGMEEAWLKIAQPL